MGEEVNFVSLTLLSGTYSFLTDLGNRQVIGKWGFIAKLCYDLKL